MVRHLPNGNLAGHDFTTLISLWEQNIVRFLSLVLTLIDHPHVVLFFQVHNQRSIGQYGLQDALDRIEAILYWQKSVNSLGGSPGIGRQL